MKRSNDAGSRPPTKNNGVAEVKTVNGDALDRLGAIALAKRLEKYWHDQGYLGARFWAEPIDEHYAKVGTRQLYRVACNLVNGLPPLCRADISAPAVGPPQGQARNVGAKRQDGMPVAVVAASRF